MPTRQGRHRLCIAGAGPEDGRAALDAAAEAQESWAKVPARELGEILRRAFELVTARLLPRVLRLFQTLHSCNSRDTTVKSRRDDTGDTPSGRFSCRHWGLLEGPRRCQHGLTSHLPTPPY
ncbi:hypothetical protein CFN17_04260 [Arthrobacter sp. PM3]|nr:hypothetical protein CFN17_04260 [Arthrobacter sp. PM3]